MRSKVWARPASRFGVSQPPSARHMRSRWSARLLKPRATRRRSSVKPLEAALMPTRPVPREARNASLLQGLVESPELGDRSAARRASTLSVDGSELHPSSAVRTVPMLHGRRRLERGSRGAERMCGDADRGCTSAQRSLTDGQVKLLHCITRWPYDRDRVSVLTKSKLEHTFQAP